MLERAQTLTAEKNLEGNIDDFALLHRLPDSHLISVTHDSGLAFIHESGSAEEIIPLIRAKEAAQAALAQAAARQAEALAKSAKDTGDPILGRLSGPLISLYS